MATISEINFKLKDYDWFYESGVDEYNRTVVYVHFMTMDIISIIQNTFGNVLIHFAGSKLADRDSFVNIVENIPDTDPTPGGNINFIVQDLKDSYGTNLIRDIFYEVHDGKNALTNLSAKFPEIRDRLENLYSRYGYEVIDLINSNI